MNNKQCEVFIACHKPSELLNDDVFTPIHVGRDVSFKKNKDGQLSEESVNWLKKNLIGDNTGDNISCKNPYYCELTAQYWAWKNCKADYIGLMHYRRHLSFDDNMVYKENIYGLVEAPLLNTSYINKFKLDSEHILKMVSQYDIITVKPWNVTYAGSKNNYDHYASSNKKLHIKDYDEALKILQEKYPEFAQDVCSYNKSRVGYYTNIFIMKKELFNEYNLWLFDILFELEKRIDISKYDNEESRIFGYISEWLFGIYVFHLKRVGSYKIKELQRTFVLNCGIVQNKDNINICFAVDNHYAQHLGVAITSILKNISSKRGVDIYVIVDNSVKSKNRKRLLQLKKLRENTNITLLNLNNEIFDGFPEPLHFTKAIYYRFIIPSLFESLDKIIYLDSDLIVRGDIEELYNIELENYFAAAVQDIIGFTNQYRLNLNKWKEYYCNSGVLVMNLQKMRQANTEAVFIKTVKDNLERLCWPDQDVINIVLEGKIKYLDLSWNFQYYLNKSPYDFKEKEFKKAKSNPNIVHFIGKYKPWDFKVKRLYGKEYFYYLMFTPWKYMMFQYSIKEFKFKLIQILSVLFSIRNENTKKRVTILGIKFKLKDRGLENRTAILNLSKQIDINLSDKIKEIYKVSRRQQQVIANQRRTITKIQDDIKFLTQKIEELCG